MQCDDGQCNEDGDVAAGVVVNEFVLALVTGHFRWMIAELLLLTWIAGGVEVERPVVMGICEVGSCRHAG